MNAKTIDGPTADDHARLEALEKRSAAVQGRRFVSKKSSPFFSTGVMVGCSTTAVGIVIGTALGMPPALYLAGVSVMAAIVAAGFVYHAK